MALPDPTTPFVWGAGGEMLTPTQIASRRRVADAMIAQGSDYSPVRSPWQGVARVAQAMLGGYESGQLDRSEKDAARADASLRGQLVAALSGTPAASPAGPVSTAPPSAPGGAPLAGAPAPVRMASADPGAPLPAASRPEVAPSAKVWGDKEAEAAGLYEPSAKPAARPAASPAATVAAAMPGRGPGPVAAPPPAAGPAPATAPAEVRAPINPAIVAAVTSPYASEATRAIGLQLLAQAMKPRDFSYQTTPDGTILRMDPRGGAPVPVYTAATKPQFTEIGTDPATGLPVKGFVDLAGRKVEEYRPANASAAPSTIPPAPAGVDPKVWREAQSKRAAEEGMPASSDTTSKLRNEVQGLPSYKNLAQAAPVYKSMLDAAGRDNRAADVNMIYAMAKIMDPGSVVRESEMTIAQAVATLPQQIRQTVESQLTSGGRLSQDVRAALMGEAHSRLTAYQAMFDQDAAMYRGIAQRGRMNEADVLPSFGPFEPFKPAAAAPAPAPATPAPGRVRRYNPASGKLE